VGRRRLNEALFVRTLEVVAAAVGIDQTLVVTRSGTLRRIAAARGALALAERGNGSLNEALAQAAIEVAQRGAAAALSISCDLPLLSVVDVEAMIEAASATGIVLAPDRAGTGTNAMLVAPVGAIPYRYGPGSFEAHAGSAHDAGLSLRVIRTLGLAFDMDTPADLREMQRGELPIL